MHSTSSILRRQRHFEVGQRVEIDFEERGIPPIWHRVYVMDLRPVEGP